MTPEQKLGLKSLILSGDCDFDQSVASMLSQAFIGKMPPDNLAELKLVGCNIRSTLALTTITQTILQGIRLNTLVLSKIKIGDSAIKNLC